PPFAKRAAAPYKEQYPLPPDKVPATTPDPKDLDCETCATLLWATRVRRYPPLRSFPRPCRRLASLAWPGEQRHLQGNRPGWPVGREEQHRLETATARQGGLDAGGLEGSHLLDECRGPGSGPLVCRDR